MRRTRVKATVFLGGGRITGALIAGLRLARDKTPLVVHDRNAHKLRALQRAYGVKVEPDLGRAIAQLDWLIIAVRPDSVVALLEKTRQAASLPVGDSKGKGGVIRPARDKQAKRPILACSLAAGIPLAKLRAALGPPVRWARAMPSPVARSGRGLTAVTFERSFPAAARKRIRGFFGKVGPVMEIPERQFDAFTATYSSSHGYYALAGLARAAQKLGLDRKTALAAAAHALTDGILSWREGTDSLEELLDEAATPGGISATVMRTMDRAGHARIVERGLRAGVARAKNPGR
jgi:pyrroline-5-carboxylate reductase